MRANRCSYERERERESRVERAECAIEAQEERPDWSERLALPLRRNSRRSTRPLGAPAAAAAAVASLLLGAHAGAHRLHPLRSELPFRLPEYVLREAAITVSVLKASVSQG